jgi:hypothetical protein
VKRLGVRVLSVLERGQVEHRCQFIVEVNSKIDSASACEKLFTSSESVREPTEANAGATCRSNVQEQRDWRTGHERCQVVSNMSSSTCRAIPLKTDYQFLVGKEAVEDMIALMRTGCRHVDAPPGIALVAHPPINSPGVGCWPWDAELWL